MTIICFLTWLSSTLIGSNDHSLEQVSTVFHSPKGVRAIKVRLDISSFPLTKVAETANKQNPNMVANNDRSTILAL